MSKYSLFAGPDKNRVEEAVDGLLGEFAEKYEALKEVYPHIGLGDTATDERMVQRLYGVLHFNDWEWPEKMEQRYTGGPASTPPIGTENAALEEA